MPHAVLKLVGGANTNETPALNENSGIAQTNLIRFFYDANGITLCQKLGGWTKFYASQMLAIVRALWAWEDLNVTAHLALGTQTIAGQDYAQLAVITNGALEDITPTGAISNIAPALESTAGSAAILITDNTTTGITNYDTVYIATPISIGGVILFGLYPTGGDGILEIDGYSVYAVDQLGNLWYATANSTSPVLPVFTTGTLGSTTVNVYFPNYTYAVGDTFPVLTPTTVGGITLYGNYVVQSLVDVNNFKIIADSPTTVAGAMGTLNGGLAQFIYSLGVGAIQAGTGYGIGMYGYGGYGTGIAIEPATGTNINASDWTLDNWGEILIACPITPQPPGTAPFQPIYQWDVGAATATIIPQAPPVNDGIFVAMPQRQIVAWGSTETGIQDPLLINWCDVNNFNQWIALVTNQAGSYRIPKGSRIVGCVQGPQQAIVHTDVDAWSMQYVGPPYVYSFNEIGTGCGLISRKACIFVNGVEYWMGPSQFFTLSSYGVQPLSCSVWDQVFGNLDQNNLTKIRVAVNSRFNEIQWFYPSVTGGTGENDSYVKLNTVLQLWDYGQLGRSAWVDQSVLGPPIGADPASLYLYQHETSNDADAEAMLPSFTSGYFTISEGDNQSFIDLVWPDFKWQYPSGSTGATVQISFNVVNYPGDTPRVFGPYSVTQATKYFNTRLRGRLVSVTISSSDMGTWWRTGAMRYRFAADGKFG
jgi:hypothetical protein